MFVIAGTRLYRKVDHVPGRFFVATRFLHFFFIPIVPLGSVLVVEGARKSEPSWEPEIRGLSGRLRFSSGTLEAIPLRLQPKSFLLAWLRLILWAAAVLFTISTIGALSEAVLFLTKGKEAKLLACLVILVMTLGFWFSLWLSYRLSRPTRRRALFLAQLAGLPEGLITPRAETSRSALTEFRDPITERQEGQ